MELRTYLDASARGTAAAIAKAVDVSPVMVTQWANGVKEVPVERCLDIERATEGQVTRADLRPNDFWRYWPDLKAPKAKAAPSTQEA